MKHYFITGATGAIGAALIPVLLEDLGTSVTLLIRADNQDHLAARLEKLFVFWAFDPRDERKSRVNAVLGDISQPNFGMKDKAYKIVSDQCSHIIHCAGNVRMNLPLEEARKCAVDSARNVVALAEVCRENDNLEKIEFVSTVGVGGRMPVVPESWIEQEREFHNTYEQAKAEAEDYIRIQAEKGLPITVHRPSMVVGASKTGKIIHFQIFYYICEFLSGSRTLGFTPDTKKTRLDLIPCDYVAKAIAWSSKSGKTIGMVMHESSGLNYSILISDLKKLVQKNFCKNKKQVNFTIPVWTFKLVMPMLKLLVPEEARRSMGALPIFFDYLKEHQIFENKKTIALLIDSVEFPKKECFLEQGLSYYLDRK